MERSNEIKYRSNKQIVRYLFAVNSSSGSGSFSYSSDSKIIEDNKLNYKKLKEKMDKEAKAELKKF